MAFLITGFEPFADVTENPSALVVAALNIMPAFRSHVYAEILPTEYAAASRRMEELVRTRKPEAYIALGFGGGSVIRLERTAYNLDDADAPDNSGEVRAGIPIDPEAPALLTATLPIETMFAVLAQHGIPAAISSDPGRFICNHVYFHALRLKHTPCCFIHLPMHSEAGDGPSLPLSMIVEAVTLCMSVASSSR